MMFFSLFVIAGTAANWSQLSLLGDKFRPPGGRIRPPGGKIGPPGGKTSPDGGEKASARLMWGDCGFLR